MELHQFIIYFLGPVHFGVNLLFQSVISSSFLLGAETRLFSWPLSNLSLADDLGGLPYLWCTYITCMLLSKLSQSLIFWWHLLL